MQQQDMCYLLDGGLPHEFPFNQWILSLRAEYFNTRTTLKELAIAELAYSFISNFEPVTEIKLMMKIFYQSSYGSTDQNINNLAQK